MLINDTEYLYASARIHALEATLIGSERMNQMIEASSAGEVYATLAECGVPTVLRGEGDDIRPDEEATLAALISDAFTLIGELAPAPALFRFLKYPYDCNNLKAVLKCAARGIDPDDLLFDCGTVPPDAVKRAASDRNYEIFPPHMAQAVKEASEAYAQSRDPQTIDLILDRACYADMKDATKDDPYLTRLVVTRIDLTNIQTAFRLLRHSDRDAALLLLPRTLLPGGELSERFFRDGFSGGEGKLTDALSVTRYGKVLAGLDVSVLPLGVLECACDNYYMDCVKEARMVPFGSPVLCGYLVAREYEAKNARIILGGKNAGLSPDTIRARVRRGYV